MKNIKKLTLLHSNDMHGDFMVEKIDEKLVGGVSLLSGYVSKVRQEEQSVLYAVAGDMFRGSVIDTEYKGISTINIKNAHFSQLLMQIYTSNQMVCVYSTRIKYLRLMG